MRGKSGLGRTAGPERCRRIARDLALQLAAGTAEELADRARPPRIVSLSVDPEVVLEGSKVTVTIEVENHDYACVTFPDSDGPREVDRSGPMQFCARATGLVTVQALNALNPQVTASTPIRVEHIPRFDMPGIDLPDTPLLSGVQISDLVRRFDALQEESLDLHSLTTDPRRQFSSSEEARGDVASTAEHLAQLSETAVEAARARAAALGLGAAWRTDQPATPPAPDLPEWPPVTRAGRRVEPR